MYRDQVSPFHILLGEKCHFNDGGRNGGAVLTALPVVLKIHYMCTWCMLSKTSGNSLTDNKHPVYLQWVYAEESLYMVLATCGWELLDPGLKPLNPTLSMTLAHSVWFEKRSLRSLRIMWVVILDGFCELKVSRRKSVRELCLDQAPLTRYVCWPKGKEKQAPFIRHFSR